MSKNNKKGASPEFNYGYGYIVGESTPDYLVGRILTIVEALGLKESQEKSIKDLVRQEIWNQFSTMDTDWGALFITPNLNTEIRKSVKEIKQSRNELNLLGGYLVPEDKFTLTLKED